MHDPMLSSTSEAGNAERQRPWAAIGDAEAISENRQNQRFVKQLERSLASFYDKGTRATVGGIGGER